MLNSGPISRTRAVSDRARGENEPWSLAASAAEPAPAREAV